MDNPISWDYLTTRPGENEVFGPFAVLFLIAFAAGFLISIIVYNGWTRKFFPNPVLHRMARRWSAWALGIFGFGLFFFLVRVLQISLLTFEMRIWMWLAIFAVGVFCLYMVYDMRRNYSDKIAEYEAEMKKRQYMRATAAAGVTLAPSPGRPTVRKRR